jgi:hypothetical protein
MRMSTPPRLPAPLRPLALLAALVAAPALLAQPAAGQGTAAYAADAAITADLRASAESGETTYFSQAWLVDTMERRSGSLEEVPRVYYSFYVVPPGHNRLQARLAVYERFGDRDVVKPLLWLLNRNDLENLSPGDTLIVPNHFGLDFRAYSPFPRYYPGARAIDKVVILEKNIQAWAAYEYGELQRWGIISTGNESSRTPSGRFNVNWKQEERVSTLSPGVINPRTSDELWTMYWVMNIHETRGIHMHQYALPTSGPASHGCVRMLEPDAQWLYHWTDTWAVQGQRDPISSAGARILSQGSMVLVIGEDISGPPKPFLHRERYPVLRMVNLPPDPWAVRAGSPQQEQFDRVRARG